MLKRKTVQTIIVLMITLFALTLSYAEPCKSSGEQTGSALIKTGYGSLLGIMVSTDGTNSVTLDVYDSTSATGTKLIPSWVVTTSSTDRAQYLQLPGEVRFDNGCYVEATTSGTVNYVVYYK